MLPFLATLISPVSSLITSWLKGVQHSKDMKELSNQKELEIEKTKVELAKTATTADSLVALENLKQPLGDKGFRRVLIIVMSSPFWMMLPDLVGFPQYGSQVVYHLMLLIKANIPETYQLFVLSMVASYFGIQKVKETFFKK